MNAIKVGHTLGKGIEKGKISISSWFDMLVFYICRVMTVKLDMRLALIVAFFGNILIIGYFRIEGISMVLHLGNILFPWHMDICLP